ncbi:hypothetical protein ACIGEZ_31470 [Streptomyces sp. NPDC085481]|uniref:MmyB family transcriptional regulator n=1 Tax=Streptomyces sp. NPDC085481 TaxID=3365727 RepID=UPI0037D8CEB6
MTQGAGRGRRVRDRRLGLLAADFLRRSRDRIRPQGAGLPAGPRRRTPGPRRRTPGPRRRTPGPLHLLGRLPTTPAQILNDLGDVPARNAMARALLGGVCTVSEHGRNAGGRTRGYGLRPPPARPVAGAAATRP